jgi:hypothetical protein
MPFSHSSAARSLLIVPNGFSFHSLFSENRFLVIGLNRWGQEVGESSKKPTILWSPLSKSGADHKRRMQT